MRFAGSFYPSSVYECKRMIEDMQKSPYEMCGEIAKIANISGINAGIVPHAGWVFSGKISFGVFNEIKKITDIDKNITFVLFSANHSAWISKSTIMTNGVWETPFGEILIDEDVAGKILKEGKFYLENNADAHADEHSIEVQLPFIKFLFPNAKIIPVMPVMTTDVIEVGKIVGNVVKKEKENGERITIIGTSDLTHYGLNYGFAPKGSGSDALKWVKEVNDKKMIDLILDLEQDKIIKEAEKNMNACGPGAITATVSAAKILGCKKGMLLKYTTSYDVFPRYGMDSYVGYAGILF